MIAITLSYKCVYVPPFPKCLGSDQPRTSGVCGDGHHAIQCVHRRLFTQLQADLRHFFDGLHAEGSFPRLYSCAHAADGTIICILRIAKFAMYTGVGSAA